MNILLSTAMRIAPNPRDSRPFSRHCFLTGGNAARFCYSAAEPEKSNRRALITFCRIGWRDTNKS
jgi:hypothetical protein